MSRIIRKFKFGDLNLAFKVRGNMWNTLVTFDLNKNKYFQEAEIKQALISILGEDEMQVDYVIKNVFRYDRDGDGAITYPQFTNFSVQQHFGQMAIQRLHRNGYYANGVKRIMNLQQFQNTLNYCLNFINSKGNHSEYQRLFNQVDLDQDGFISYQDYFIFLKQYFGSQSEAFEQEQKNQGPITIPPPKIITPPPVVRPVVPKFTDGNGETPEQRFAKLIYSQFKVQVMEKDRNKNLLLQKNEAEDIISSIFKLNYSEEQQLINKVFRGSSSVKYQDFIRTAVVTYFSEISARKNVSSQINQDDFVNIIQRVCFFVSIRPAQHIVRACFKSTGRSSISQSEYSSLLRRIFQNFQFDTRGLPSISRSQATSYQAQSYNVSSSGYQASFTSGQQNRYY